jgi:hypothetical protein
MTDVAKSTHRNVRIGSAIIFSLVLCITTAAALPQAHQDFSGLWKQDNDRCQPKRNGEVKLHIEHHDQELTVETSISRNSGSSRHAVQRYTTDGTVSTSTGADGDEFHTSIVWNGQNMVFSIEEHEDGRVILSKETWTLIDNGAALVKVREGANSGERQTIIYLRQSQ